MRTVPIVALWLVSLGGVAPAALAALSGPVLAGLADPAPPSTSPSVKKAAESALACDREAMTAAQRKRHFEELGPALRKLKRGVRELPDGFEIEFPGDRATYAMVSEWVEGERACCPFFDISLRSDREGGPVRLQPTGREGVKQFIATEGRAWFEGRPTSAP